MKNILMLILGVHLMSCRTDRQVDVHPMFTTEKTNHDTDDPAIWLNPENPQKSLVFGTDKDTDGAIYAFDLNGKIVKEKTIRGLKRPNNVDVAYDLKINDSVTTDILIFTERERNQFRVFSLPDMRPLDNGGIKVFQGSEGESSLPMGISSYRDPSGEIYVIVGRKNGPPNKYLEQYQLRFFEGEMMADKIRSFGKFSGVKEIEAIAVDQQNGFIYYADEGVCIRKYYADPKKGDEELQCFGKGDFKEDIEGIAIAASDHGRNLIVVSNQQDNSFNFYDANSLELIGNLNLGTLETDGCEVTTKSLGASFPKGLFVAMNNDRNFYYYDLGEITDKLQSLNN